MEAPVRGETARDILKLHWDFPVFQGGNEELAQTGSFAKARRQALPKDEALRFIAGDDPRPLVVVRECGWCEGSDDALLSTRLDNDKTILLSHWFHVVKLPNHVLQDDHPFSNLFDDDEPAHLFVATADGEKELPLSGEQSQTELWNALSEVLDLTYEDNPERAVQRIYKLLDRFDELDEADARLHAKFSEELEKRGPKSSKLKRIRKDIDKVESEREDVRSQLEKLRDLGLAGD